MSNRKIKGIGNRVKRCREQLLYQRRELAEIIGLPDHSFYKIETGKKLPAYEELMKITTFFKEEWVGDRQNLYHLLELVKKYKTLIIDEIDFDITSIPILILEKRKIDDKSIYFFTKTNKSYPVRPPILDEESTDFKNINNSNDVTHYYYINITENNVLRGIPKDSTLLVRKFRLAESTLYGYYIVQIDDNDFDICLIKELEPENKFNHNRRFEVFFQDAKKDFSNKELYSNFYRRDRVHRDSFKLDNVLLESADNVFTVKFKLLTIISNVNGDIVNG